MEQVMKHYGNAILAIIVLLALGAIIIGGALLGRICGDGVQECADGILFPHEWLNAIGRMTWGRS